MIIYFGEWLFVIIYFDAWLFAIICDNVLCIYDYLG